MGQAGFSKLREKQNTYRITSEKQALLLTYLFVPWSRANCRQKKRKKIGGRRGQKTTMMKEGKKRERERKIKSK